MSSPEKSDTVQPGGEAEARRRFRRYLLLTVPVALSCAFLVAQTEWYVSLPSPPGGVEQMRLNMEADREKQKQMGDRYRAEKKGEPVRRLVFDSICRDQTGKLESAKEFLLSEQTFEKEFKRKYGVSLRDVNALVIPAWHLNNPDNQERFGFTEAGWVEARRIAGSLNVGGYTIRDGVGAREATLDGTPRILISFNAFTSEKKLRQTLFHEMLHALNVAQHYPSRINFTRSDLVYLPEYREFLQRTKLKNDESWLWYLLIYPLLITTLALFLTALFNAPSPWVRLFLTRLRRKASSSP